ncbi:MAG: sigma-70 family RNA polymerase sigma factor [Bacillaceae bacterium]|nr:sigma-70 family RNA polymerase sigma factor [Bacillaceae bacterium]
MVEQELISAAQSGDRDALIRLLREIEHSVYRTAYYMLGNEHDAMDAAQEALIRIYTKIDTYQQKAKFTTWVQRIVTNICIDKFRRKKDTVSIDEHNMMFQSSHNVEEEIERSGIASDIKDAINQLPDKQRTVVTLRYLQDMTYQEIADTLEMPLNTVKSYLFRARLQLQEWLQEYEKGGVRG